MIGEYHEGSLDGSIEDAIDDFRTRRARAFVADDADQALTTIERIAGLILAASEDLTDKTGDWDEAHLWQAFRTLTDDTALRPHVVEELQIALAWRHAPTSQAMARRCLELTVDIIPKQPDASVLKYLRLLTRCYIAGFSAECLMVCGSVLEQEIKAVFERKQLPLPATAAGKSQMKSRIAAAHRFKWLSSDGKRAAEEVWLRRCKTTHEDPELVKQAREK